MAKPVIQVCGCSVLLLALCISSTINQSQQAAQGTRHRYNVHEPLFADEDLVAGDVHTVSAGPSTSLPTRHLPQISRTSSQPAPQSIEPHSPTSASGSSSWSQTRAVSALQTPTPAQSNLPKARLTTVELKKAPSTAKRQISTLVVSADDPIVQQSRQVANSRSDRSGSASDHWTALNNYYKTIGAGSWIADSRTRQSQAQQPQQQQPPIIIDTQQQKVYDDDIQHDIQQQLQQSYNQQPKQVYATIDQASSSVRYPSASTNLRSPFELPTQALGQQQQQQQQRQQQQQQLLQQQQRQTCECKSGQPIALAQFDQIVQQQVPISDWGPYELTSLPEKIFFNQQQTRARHQQDTFGSLVDRGIQEQLQQEEMNCGPRNLVRNLRSYASRWRRPEVVGSSSLATSVQQQLQPAFGEYPSHLGLYNGSQANDNNFLCSASLIHARFALTLASCVANLNSSNSLLVRTGEWNANRKTISEPDRQLIMMTRQVTRVHPFPRYPGLAVSSSSGGGGSNEHNLALLEWTKPIDFPLAEYISPACQPQSRSSLRMRSCWAPVRNITISSYFDADGDGETKLKQDVQMVEVPISLIAADDGECRRLTHSESFSFLHPNYICSADFKQNQWRAKLRQSQYMGSGIYCDEGGMMSLVSMMHPIQTANTTADYGYIDLSYYRPWMRNIIHASQAGRVY